MSGVLAKILSAPARYPLVRGMLSYAIIWPTCSLVQEYLEHGTSLAKANWARAARFSFFGTFFMAPVFYGWMKYSSRFFKRKDLMTAISRAAVEQVSYSPLAMVYFFFGMNMLEGKPYKVCAKEVREKFWPTYKMGVVFWPTAQTFNFYFVSEKNRIVFVSLASFLWTVYLAHMKGKDQKEKHVVGSDPSLLNIEPMSVNLDPADDVPVTDKASLVASEISEISSNVTSSSLNPIADIKDIKSDVESTPEAPMLVVDRTPEERSEKQPQLISDIHPDGESHLIVETLTDPEIEEEEEETKPRMTVEEMAEILFLMS